MSDRGAAIERAAATWIAAVEKAERTGSDADWIAANEAYRAYQQVQRA